MWEAIQWVTTPLALIAFIVAVAATVLRARVASTRKLIEAAPEESRPDLIYHALETYSIKNDNLTRQQKVDLFRTVIDSRERRFMTLAISSVIVAILLAATALGITMLLSPARSESLTEPDYTEPPMTSSNIEVSAMVEQDRFCQSFEDGECDPVAYAFALFLNNTGDAAEKDLRIEVRLGGVERVLDILPAVSSAPPEFVRHNSSGFVSPAEDTSVTYLREQLAYSWRISNLAPGQKTFYQIWHGRGMFFFDVAVSSASFSFSERIMCDHHSKVAGMCPEQEEIVLRK